MVLDTTQQPLKDPKPRRWYRRRGWQVFSVLILGFVGWFIWAANVVAERNAFLLDVEKHEGCLVYYSAPDGITSLQNTDWFPDSIADWLYHQTRFVTGFYFENSVDKPPDEAVLAAIADRPWPTLTRLSFVDRSIWNGPRLLLPK